jgi:serine phosphatase RsbU (regulator of sigma subunit)
MVSSSDILNAKVLIVDDLEPDVRLLEHMLRSAGYASIASTMDPHEVCELHHRNHYDLILLDLQMPGMDGFQVMEGLKEIETDGYLPVLVITAEAGHKLRALQAGAKDFISKPFDLAEVRARVYNMLEVRLLHMETKNYSKALLEQHNLLQQALLPVEMYTTPGYALATRFIPGAPGKYIGGDFYDVFETEDGKTALLMGDVTGKGVEAASLAVAVRSTIRAFAYDFGRPDQALTHANAVTYAQSRFNERFATVFLATLDTQTGQFSYASAGHPPSMVLRADGRVELLSSGQFPIGIDRQAVYKSSESQLSSGDKLVMYTDGITESRKKSSRMYGEEGVQVTLEQCGDCMPEEILDEIFRAAMDASEGQLLDDAAVIIIGRDA